MLTPFHPPNPCGDDHYSTTLSIGGGSPPYRWRVESQAGDWRIEPNVSDGSEVQLSGDPAGETKLRITVTDDSNLVNRTLFTIAPRSACYLAYVYSVAGSGKLAVRDPLLTIDVSAHLANNAGVFDFQFSPDGRYLAYRFDADAQHPKGAHLSLFDFSNLSDHPLDLEADSIEAYAWSADSKILAISLTSESKSKLSGVRLTSDGVATTITPLTATTSSYPIESELFWVDSQFVAFHTTATRGLPVPAGFGLRTLLYARLTANGFATPVAITDLSYRPGELGITRVPNGLLVSSPADERSIFNSIRLDNVFTVNHHTHFLDPSGSYSAATVADTLQIFPITNGSKIIQRSRSGSASSCPKLLTWAGSRERIACVADVSKGKLVGGELRIFDIQSQEDAELVPLIVKGACLKNPDGTACPALQYDYDEAISAGEPRLLSPSGSWLAFLTTSTDGTEASLYWAELGAAPTLSRKYRPTGRTATAPTALSFSPSERYLLHQNGNQLWAHRLTSGSLDGDDLLVSHEMDTSESTSCSDDFVTAPLRWCGGDKKSQPFVWSRDPTTELFAYRKLGEVVAVVLSAATFTDFSFAAAPCNGACSDQFSFQPPLD